MLMSNEFEGFPVAQLGAGKKSIEVVPDNTYAIVEENSPFVEIRQENRLGARLESVLLTREQLQVLARQVKGI